MLADYFRRRRYIGAKDRAQIGEHVYAVVRYRACATITAGGHFFRGKAEQRI